MAKRDNLSGITDPSVTGDWGTEEQYWRSNFNTRPYVIADRGFDYYRPGYRYGYESATLYRGRNWNDVDRPAHRVGQVRASRSECVGEREGRGAGRLESRHWSLTTSRTDQVSLHTPSVFSFGSM